MPRSRLAGAEIFPSFASIKNPISRPFLYVLRALAALGYILLLALLLFSPHTGLLLFWGVIIPLLPAGLVIAPGLWRAVCPIALTNQTPRVLGISRGWRLPKGLADRAFPIAIGLFVLFVALRRPLLNQDGQAVAVLLIAVMTMAFTGGLLFRGRSGWCGTFCPLGPLQREYGHAPAILVPNTFCPTCVGCQSKCYDLSPQATLFDDIHDDDPRQAGQRRFFMSMMPGMIAGYFLQLDSSYGYPAWLAIYLISVLASVGLYHFALSFLGTEPGRTASVFAAVALTLFYGLAEPTVHHSIEALTGLALPAYAGLLLMGFGGIAAVLLLVNSFRLASRYDTAQAAVARTPRSSSANISVSVRDEKTGRIFSAAR